MSEFTVVLPSNVEGGEIKNTPAHYRTRFDTEIYLPESENWEVALHEISFVDSIETIHDEYFDVIKEGETKTVVYQPSDYEKVNIAYKNLAYYMQIDRAAFTLSDQDYFEMGYDAERDRIYVETKKSGVKVSMPKLYAHVFGLQRMAQQEAWTKPLRSTNVEKQETVIIQPENRVDILVRLHAYKDKRPNEYLEWVTVNYEEKHERYYFPHPIIWSQQNKLSIGVVGSPTTIAKCEYTLLEHDRIYVKRGYYKTGEELVKQLNKKGNYFSFDKVSNRFSIKYPWIELDKTLASILGFKNTTKNTIAEHAPNFRRGIYAMFVYANICEPTRIGNSTAPLLRTVSFQRGTFGESVNIIYNNPIFVPVSKRYINSIEIMLKDDMGENIPFEEGKTIVTLAFRKYV